MLNTYQSDYFDLEVSTTIQYAFSDDYENNADIDDPSCCHMALIQFSGQSSCFEKLSKL